MVEQHNDTNTVSGSAGYEEIEYFVEEVPRKRTPLQRLGCFVGLIIWFVVMLLPIAFIILAVNGEIIISHGAGIPDRHEHPRLQINLIMDAESRGLQFINSTVAVDEADTLCMETNVRYLLWEGQGAPAVFCDCYSRDSTTSNNMWQYTETIMDTCE